MKNDNFINKVFAVLLLVLAFAVGQNAWAEEFKGSGTESNPYIIASKADWNTLVSMSEKNSFSDKYFRLDADIDGVTTMVGDKKEIPFSGKIDGNGHTVTLNLSRTTEPSGDESLQGLALIHHAGDGLEIRNLTVDGTITTNCKFAAGFISYIHAGEANARKIIKITNSRSNVDIISNVDGDGTSAGFVGLSKNYVDITFENCVFDGSFNAHYAQQFSGFVGYQQKSVRTVIEKSLFAPQSVDIAADDGNHYTFCRYAKPGTDGKMELKNSYYTTAIGEAQGTPLYKLTLGEGLKAIRADADTIGNGAAVFYGTDGNNGISIGGEEYYKSGATVHLGCSQGLKISSVIYTPQGGSAGVAIIDADGTASFAMPESNTNVMALYGSVAYIDENGDEQTVSDYTLLTSNMSLSDFVNGSWFVVASKLSLEIPTAFSGDAHLILADGAEMTLKKNSGNLLVDNANLSIYGQDAGTGKLTIEVSANETNVGGSVAINGGVVEVSCKNDDGVCSGIAGNVTLNWTRNTNRVKADTYGNSNVTVAEGKFFVDDENKAYSGKLSEEQIAFIAGKVLKPTIPVKYIDADGSEQTLYDYTVLTGCLNTLEEPKKCEETKLASGQWYVVDGIVRYEGELSSAGSIHLVLKDGAKLTVDDDVYVSGEDGLTAEINIYGQSGGMGELIAKSLADYSGNIIFNGGKATINEGIKVAGKYTMNGGEVTANCATERQTGMLLGFGIVGLFVTINDGILNSTSCISDETNRLMAIYGEAAVEINGGTINLAASYSGIMGISVSINGGNVSIKKSTNGVLGKNVSFTGGNIDMDGNVTTRTNTGSFDDDDDDAIVLDWTNSTDSFKASGFVGPVVIAKGKYFTDGEGNVYSGEIAYSDENGTVLDGKTLKPFVSFVTFDAQNGSDPSTVAASFANGDWFVAAPAAPIRSGYKFLGWFTSKDGDTEFDFTAPVTASVDVYAKWVKNIPIEYVDENGETQSIAEYIELTSATDVSDLPSGWYAVLGEVKYTSQVKFKGKAHFILADGATLDVEVASGNAIDATENLTIYGQNGQSGILNASAAAGSQNSHGIHSFGDITISGGTVTASGPGFGIHGSKEVTISGGNVTATGGKDGINCNSVTINGGNVSATGGNYGIYGYNGVTISGGTITASAAAGRQNSYGIHSYNGNITISGGTVTASAAAGSQNSHGIYSNNGNITISGGTVTASGSNNGIRGSMEVTISGGTVTATGGNYGISGYSSVKINGGNVTASGEYGYGIRSYNGNITLGWTNSSDFIYASSYYSDYGSVQIAEDKSFKDEDSKEYSGMIEDRFENGTKIGTVIDGKTLVPPSFDGKFFSDVNIAVADIPVQKYADGKPVCPKSVIVTDGKDTLNAGTDYTVACFNNTAVTSATLDKAAVAQIIGKGNYAGAIQKRFFIWENIGNYAAVQVYKDKKGDSHAEIDGAYDGTDAVAIDENFENVAVKFNREFTVNLENGGFSTIMLPFDVSASNLTGVKSIFEFDDVDNNAVGVKYVWCNATIGKQESENGHPDCNTLSGELNAYTPYMVEMETPTLGIKDNVTLKPSNNATNSVVSKSNWVFRGALQKKDFSKKDQAIQKGIIWAFAGSARNGASIGKFVQFGGNNWVNPFRAYLVDCTTYSDASECKDETQSKPSLVSRYRFADALAPATSAENSLSAKTPAAVAASETALLNSMDIVIVYGDKDSVGERPTVIGRMNPDTGEIRMLPRTKQTYDLKGRRVNSEKRNARGAYYGKHGRK